MKAIGLIFILLTVTLLGSGGIVQSAPLAQEPAEPPDLDLVLLIDESGSVWFRTDPERDPLDMNAETGVVNPKAVLPDPPPYRIQAAQLLINMLAVETEKDHNISVYLFGSRTEPVVENVTLSVNNYQDINEAIKQKHYELGATLFWTDIDAALTQALEQLRDRRDPDRRSAVVLITDGRPETEVANLLTEGDTEPTEEQQVQYGRYLNQIKGTIAELDEIPNASSSCPSASSSVRPVYLLAVDQEANKALSGTPYVGEEYPNFWIQPNVVGGQYRPVLNFPGLNAVISNLVAELLCLPEQQLTEPLALPQRYSFEVEENFSSLLFTILTDDSNRTTTIQAPGIDAPISDDTPGVTVTRSSTSEVWRMQREGFPGSWAGTWDVQVDGQGTVQFAFTQSALNYIIRLLRPAENLHPAGKSLDLVGEIIDTEAQPYAADVQDFEVAYNATLANGQEVSKTLVSAPDQQDAYRYEARLDTPPAGTYTFRMNARLADNQTAALAPAKTLQIVVAPFANIVAPRVGSALNAGELLEVQVLAQIMTSADPQPRPVDPLRAADATVNAVLRQDRDAPAVSEVQLEPTGGETDTHAGQLQLPDQPGNYVLEVTLEYETSGGILKDSAFVEITVGAAAPVPETPQPKPEPQTVAPTPNSNGLGIIAGVLGVLVAAAGAGGAWALFMRGPKLAGVTLDGPGGPQPLSGRGHIIKLTDSAGNMAKVKLQMNSSGEVEATILKADGDVRIGNSWLSQGDVQSLQSGQKIALKNGDEYQVNY